MHNHGFSAELEPFRRRFAVKYVFHVIWGKVHLVVTYLNKGVYLGFKIQDVLFRTVQNDFIPSGYYLQVRVIAA